MSARLNSLEHWHEFYLLLGTAASAFIALLFVAASIGAGIMTAQRTSATRIYMSPVIVHFAAVLYVSAIALIPSHTTASFGLLLGTAAMGGLVYSAGTAIRVFRDGAVDMADRLAYGLAPLVGYTGGVISVSLFIFRIQHAPEVLACSLILLLIVNIRNAWDLTIFFVRKHSDSG
jgi:hypothetical protein